MRGGEGRAIIRCVALVARILSANQTNKAKLTAMSARRRNTRSFDGRRTPSPKPTTITSAR